MVYIGLNLGLNTVETFMSGLWASPSSVGGNPTRIVC